MKNSVKTFIAALLAAEAALCCFDTSASAAEADSDISATDVSAYPDTDPALVIAGKRIGNSRGAEISIPDPKEPVEIFDTDGKWAEGLETKDMKGFYGKWAKDLAPEKALTTKVFKEFLSSKEKSKLASVYYGSGLRNLFDPLGSGEITLSEPFRIPYYFAGDKVKFRPAVYTWYSAIFRDGKLCALLQLDYNAGCVLSNNIFYLPYELTERIDKGEEISLFCVQAYTKINGYENLCGDIYYSIDKSGNSNLERIEYNSVYTDLINDLDVKTTKADHAIVSRYITLSKDMVKVAGVNNTFSPGTDLKNGGTVTLRNRSDLYYIFETAKFRFKAERKYIVNEAGRDESGEMTYTLSSAKNPDKKLTVSGSEKLYLRCASISGEPLYKISPVTDTGKVLAVSDGRLKAEKWTGDTDQLWYIKINNG